LPNYLRHLDKQVSQIQYFAKNILHRLKAYSYNCRTTEYYQNVSIPPTVGGISLNISIAFGKVLRELRLKKGLSQEQLGFEADLRRTYVSILELGQQQPSLTTLLKLANALNIKASQLMALLEEKLNTKT